MSTNGDSHAQIAFYGPALPALPAEEYEVTVTQTVKLPSPLVSPDPYVTSHNLRISGPHFGLDPGDLVSSYPPAGSQSDYSTTLPHAVLGRKTLPWEILAREPQGDIPPLPQDVPWVALLLFAVDEQPVPGKGEIHFPPDSGPANATGTQTVPLADYLSPPEGTAGPVFTQKEIETLEAENPDLTCVVVDVDAEAFAAVAPALEELPYLAHVRQSIGADQAFEGTGEGWFSVVVANRLPARSGGRYVAQLVSLEGFVPYLPGQTRPAGNPPTALRLVSLASWAFLSLPEGPDFDALMEALDSDLLRRKPPDFGASPTPAETAVEVATVKGYCGLAYGTRSGEHTAAWYRGPCHPVPMERLLQPAETTPAPRFPTADAALVYDETTAMFDASFAVAWELGRTLALANRQFTLALTAWVRQGVDLAYLLAERLAYFENVPGEAPAELAELLAPDLMRRGARSLLTRRLGPGPGSMLAGLGPPRDPTRLHHRFTQLPGVLPSEDLRATLAAGGEPHEALLERLRSLL